MLSIVIVNYHSLDLIRGCLDTLMKYHEHFEGEIIIVNNSTEDDKVAKFREDYPTVLWHEMGYNAGFARANNKGILQSKGEYVLLLNPDIIFIETILDRCLERMKNSPQVVAHGVQLLNEDGSFQISGSYFIKGGLNHLLPLPYWGNVLRSIALSMNTKVPHLKESSGIEIEQVDWINGAFILARKAVLEKSGLLDEDFFMYSEEIEWCSRLRKQGELIIDNDLKLVHLLGRSSEKKVEKEYYDLYSKKGLQMIIGNHLRVRKQYGVFWLFVLFGNYLFAALIAVPISLIMNLFGMRKVTLKNTMKFLRNMLKLTTFLPRIVMNKPYFYKVM